MTHEDSVVASAPSVDEAIIVGLTRLMATRDEVEIEVLDEGSRGFLGVGARDARVRVTRRPPEALSSEEQQLGGNVAAEATKTQEMEGASAEEPHIPVSAEDDLAPTAELAAEIEEEACPTDASISAVEAFRVRAANAAEEIAHHILSGFDVELSLAWREDERPTLWISISGRDADSLVGPQGRNLRALQYLFRTLLYRQVDGDYNVVVDADGFYRRRRQSLEALARKKAEQAVASGRRVRLRAMPADERRIIHIALRDDARVETESVGRGRDRAVTIIPKNRLE